MISQDLKELIDLCLTDGILEDNERAAIVRRAEREGADLDEVQIYLNSEMQKRNMTMADNVAKHEKERAGNRCPHCSADIPPMTKICPECGKAITGNESEGDKELLTLVDDLEFALKTLKTCNVNTFRSSLADVERLVRKANTFYGENKKIKMLLFDVSEEKKAVEKRFADIEERERQELASRSVEKLTEQLAAIESERKVDTKEKGFVGAMFGATAEMYKTKDSLTTKKMNLISTFPVPMLKEELLSFMSMARTQAKKEGPRNGLRRDMQAGMIEDLGYAYWLLFTNCIEKAKVKYADDPDFAPFFSYYNEQQPHGFFQKAVAWILDHKGLSIAAVIVLFYAVIFSVLLGGNVDPEEVTEQINIGNLTKAQKLYDKMDSYYGRSDVACQLINAYLKNDDTENAEKILSGLSNSSISRKQLNLFYEYFIEKNDFESAEQYCNSSIYLNTDLSADALAQYYSWLEKYVMYLCENKKFEDAQQIVDRKIIKFYSDSDSEYSTSKYTQGRVTKKLKTLMNTYK